MQVLTIDVGGSKFSVAGFDGSDIVFRETRRTNREGGPVWMVGQIKEIIAIWRRDKGFRAECCGIGFGGPVDYPTQSVTMSTHVEGWAQFPLVSKITETVDAPTVIDNDANVGALGESYFGAGKGLPSLFYMTLSTGIGGGIIQNGTVVRGADSYAGEIGHTNILPNGPACLCGSYGCFERMCCGLWLERDFGKPASTLLLDPEFVRRYVVDLARGLKTALMVLNPHRIVIGGGISKAGNALFVPLREELSRQMTAWSKARRDVVPAQLGDDSVLYGALVLAQQMTSSA